MVVERPLQLVAATLLRLVALLVARPLVAVFLRHPVAPLYAQPAVAHVVLAAVVSAQRLFAVAVYRPEPEAVVGVV